MFILLRKFNASFQIRLTNKALLFSNQIKLNQMLGFVERGKPEYPDR